MHGIARTAIFANGHKINQTLQVPPTILCATAFEAGAVRRAAPRLRVIETGIALEKITTHDFLEPLIVCGLAGGLRSDLDTGSVVIARTCAKEDGTVITCDPTLSDALAVAAQRLGVQPVRGTLFTSGTLVRGDQRRVWAQRGYDACDMETAFVRAQRVAAIRVILDTPQRELSDAWLRPLSVLLRPNLWLQGLWLAREGPRCARLAAAIVASAFADASRVTPRVDPAVKEIR